MKVCYSHVIIYAGDELLCYSHVIVYVGQLLCYSLVIVYAPNINVVAFRYYCVYAKQQQQQKYDAYVEFARASVTLKLVWHTRF